jgi:hypothetical protein
MLCDRHVVDRRALDKLLRRAAVASDLDGLGAALLHIKDPSSAEDRARSMCLEFALWWGGVEGGSQVEPAEVQAFIGKGHEAMAALPYICLMGARAAFVGFEQASLERWIELLRVLSSGSEEMRLRRELAEVWLGLLKGASAGLSSSCQELVDACRAARINDALVDAQICHALVTFGLGQKEEGIGAARRACRMARSEALPQQELLAHLGLARLRRLLGTPYLASRILRSLAALCPVPLRPWLEWERLLAGAQAPGFVKGTSAAGRAAVALQRMLLAASDGRREDFEDALSEATSEVSGSMDAWLELQDLAICLDLRHDPEAGSVAASEWVKGERVDPPHGLHNAGLAPTSESLTTLAYIAASPGGEARRVLALGASLASDESTGVLDRQTRPQERTDTAAAMLLLSPGGEANERGFFRELYGFDYDVALHKQVLDSLVHRLKERLEGVASVHRADGTIAISLDRPVLFWDPRCQRSLADTVLDAVARTGPMTARDVAAAVGVSLRTVQAVLSDMADTQACEPRRSGRRIEYEVEDTVFSELTRSRFVKG